MKNVVIKTDRQDPIVLEEIANIRQLYLHANDGSCDYNYSQQLLLYVNELEKNKAVQTHYTQNNFGRMTATVHSDKKGIAPQVRWWANTKFYGCNGLIDDIDIEQCHPTIFLQLAQFHKLSTKYTKTFIKNRESVFVILKEKHSLNRKESKQLIYSLIYDEIDHIERKIKNQLGISLNKLPKLLYNFIIEQFKIRDALLKIYPE